MTLRELHYIIPEVSKTTIHEAVTEQLGYRKLCAHWVPKMPTALLLFVNISPSFGEFTAPLRHILPIHNVTINSYYLFANFRWTFTFCFEKSYDGAHLAFGWTLDRHCHFKHVSLKQSRFYHCQTSTAHR